MQVSKAVNALRSWWRQSIWRDVLWEAWYAFGLRELGGLLITTAPVILAIALDAGWIAGLLVVSIPAGAAICNL